MQHQTGDTAALTNPGAPPHELARSATPAEQGPRWHRRGRRRRESAFAAHIAVRIGDAWRRLCKFCHGIIGRAYGRAPLMADYAPPARNRIVFDCLINNRALHACDPLPSCSRCGRVGACQRGRAGRRRNLCRSARHGARRSIRLRNAGQGQSARQLACQGARNANLGCRLCGLVQGACRRLPLRSRGRPARLHGRRLSLPRLGLRLTRAVPGMESRWPRLIARSEGQQDHRGAPPYARSEQPLDLALGVEADDVGSRDARKARHGHDLTGDGDNELGAG
jgi:hypothetical protein